jgi:hypothetical protein
MNAPLSGKQHREFLKLQAQEARESAKMEREESRKQELHEIKLQEAAGGANQKLGHKEQLHQAKLQDLKSPLASRTQQPKQQAIPQPSPTDTVPAMLTPGEAVIPQSAAQDPKNKEAIRRMVAEGRGYSHGTVDVPAISYEQGAKGMPDFNRGRSDIPGYADGIDTVPLSANQLAVEPSDMLSSEGRRASVFTPLNVESDLRYEALTPAQQVKVNQVLSQWHPSDAPTQKLKMGTAEGRNAWNAGILQGENNEEYLNSLINAVNAPPVSTVANVPAAVPAKEVSAVVPAAVPDEAVSAVVPATEVPPAADLKSLPVFNISNEIAPPPIVAGNDNTAPVLPTPVAAPVPSVPVAVPAPAPVAASVPVPSVPVVDTPAVPNKYELIPANSSDLRIGSGASGLSGAALEKAVSSFSQTNQDRINGLIKEASVQKEPKNFLEKSLASLFGETGLFSQQDLTRFAVLAAGGMLTGSTVGGSLKYAAKDVIANADRRNAQAALDKRQDKIIDAQNERQDKTIAAQEAALDRRLSSQEANLDFRHQQTLDAQRFKEKIDDLKASRALTREDQAQLEKDHDAAQATLKNMEPRYRPEIYKLITKPLVGKTPDEQRLEMRNNYKQAQLLGNMYALDPSDAGRRAAGATIRAATIAAEKRTLKEITVTESDGSTRTILAGIDPQGNAHWNDVGKDKDGKPALVKLSLPLGQFGDQKGVQKSFTDPNTGKTYMGEFSPNNTIRILKPGGKSEDIDATRLEPTEVHSQRINTAIDTITKMVSSKTVDGKAIDREYIASHYIPLIYEIPGLINNPYDMGLAVQNTESMIEKMGDDIKVNPDGRRKIFLGNAIVATHPSDTSKYFTAVPTRTLLGANKPGVLKGEEIGKFSDFIKNIKREDKTLPVDIAYATKKAEWDELQKNNPELVQRITNFTVEGRSPFMQFVIDPSRGKSK